MSAMRMSRIGEKAHRKESSAKRVHTRSHLYDLKNLATKKSNSQKCVDEGIKGDEHVKAMQE